MPDDFYGSVLDPDDASLPTLRGDFDAADTACFSGGTFPANGAGVTTWINKGAGGSGVNLTWPGGDAGGHLYRTSSGGKRAVEITASANRSLQASGFFHSGYTWTNGYTLFYVFRPVTSITFGTNFISSSDNKTRLYGLTYTNGNQYYWLQSQPCFLRSANGYCVLGMTSGLSVIPTERMFMNGDLLAPESIVNVCQGPASGSHLNMLDGFSGTSSIALNRLLIYAGKLDHTQFLRVGWGLMQSVGVPRRPRTLIFVGNSTTETPLSGCWPARCNSSQLAGAGMPSEVWNLAKAGAGYGDHAAQASLFASLDATLAGDNRRAVWTTFVGHNDGMWSPYPYTTGTPATNTVQWMYQEMLTGVRANGHRTICVPVTPYRGQSSTLWAESRSWCQTRGPLYHDGQMYHHLEAWADSVNDPPTAGGAGNEGAGAAGYWADSVHFTATGLAALAALACTTNTSNPTVAPIPHQIRAITAGRCVASSPADGEVQLARPGHDDAALPVSLYLVGAGGSAPTGAETPTLTVAAASASGTTSVAAGSYDAYAWSGTGPVMSLGQVTVGGGGLSRRRRLIRAGVIRAVPPRWLTPRGR